MIEKATIDTAIRKEENIGLTKDKWTKIISGLAPDLIGLITEADLHNGFVSTSMKLQTLQWRMVHSQTPLRLQGQFIETFVEQSVKTFITEKVKSIQADYETLSKDL